MNSPLIHLVPGEPAPAGAHPAAQFPDHRHRPLGPLLAPRVPGQPQPELLIEGGVLLPRPLASRLDHPFVRAQRDVLHRPDSSGSIFYTNVVYTMFVSLVLGRAGRRFNSLPAGSPRPDTWSGLG